MKSIIREMEEDSRIKEILKEIKSKTSPIVISGLSDVAKTLIISVLKKNEKKPICIITYNELQAKKLIKDLSQFINEYVYFPKKEIVTYEYEAESREIQFARIEVLNSILEKKNQIVVTTIEAIMQTMIPKDVLYKNKTRLKVGQNYGQEKLKENLQFLGYERKEIIEGKGEYTVRGGIIDISLSKEQGVRIEFWGDEIDSIRTFSIASQRSKDMINEISIFPANEYIIEKVDDNLKKEIEEIYNGNYTKQIDKYINSFYQKKANFLDYIDEDYLIVLDEETKIKQRIDNVIKDNENLAKNMIEREKRVPDIINNIIDYEFEIGDRQTVYLERQDKISRSTNTYNLKFRELNYFKSEIEILLNEIQEGIKEDKKILILTGNEKEAEKIINILEDKNIKHRYLEEVAEKLKKSEVTVTIGELTSGFEYYDAKLIVIASEELFGRVNKNKRVNPIFKKAEKIVYADLEAGDFVVHKNYGIGQFIGINTIKADGTIKDYIKIRYKDDAILYIPTNDMDNIRKYVGAGDTNLKLNRLGGKEWANTKAKVKRNLREVANELIELYAKRKKSIGFSFSPDTEWQRQFEDDFKFVETEDQLRCIEETKQDMQSNKPMDRLLCGDVGYGKTEVAIRAAFKAVMDSKQVAYLVPTTILANQQYETFKQRMEKYSINVEVLNRFKTAKEQKEIIRKLALGQIDVVVGTHRLLSKDVEFKDLGLLIIDEEHRFGVRAKEKIKQLKANIDVLSMSATPIPRTMHMSIIGVRDMSVIYEPPSIRVPVQTYVLEYDPEIIREAILKELERGGQVFYLYNNVGDIERKQNEISRLVPEARIAYAHGKMSGAEIEDIMQQFINKEIDIIVCTTILESGIDVPNANTIIVENADRLGLAQLYQIRGRVGRSDKHAYAYITYKRDKMISEVAEKRLKAIKEFTEFGSGFKIAMRDLEIRGAGSLLGEIQHGHIDEVGYETYCQLLEETVKEVKGIKVEQTKDIQIDIDVTSYIPNSYISNESQKIEMYQNIALCKTEEDIQNVVDEMIDRYGVMPKEVENLLQVARIKQIGMGTSVEKIKQRREKAVFILNRDEFNMDKIDEIQKIYKNKIRFTAIDKPTITLTLEKNSEENVLKEIKEFLINLNNEKKDEEEEVVQG